MKSSKEIRQETQSLWDEYEGIQKDADAGQDWAITRSEEIYKELDVRKSQIIIIKSFQTFNGLCNLRDFQPCGIC